jgi:hypothetical protein
MSVQGRLHKEYVVSQTVDKKSYRLFKKRGIFEFFECFFVVKASI